MDAGGAVAAHMEAGQGGPATEAGPCAGDAHPKLGWNLLAGLASTLWTAVVTIATVPFYLRYLGVEAYGLVGFFAAVQAGFALLELGLSQTINREMARTCTDRERGRTRDLLHTLAVGYWAVAGTIALGLWAAAPSIADVWLISAGMDRRALTQAVALIGLVVASRFPLSLYLGVLMGARRVVSASGIEIAMVALANLGAIAILAAISPTIQAFFLWQALVGLVNVAVVRAMAWRTLGCGEGAARARFDPAGLRRVGGFTVGLALSTVIGFIFVHGDKLILSKMVGLADLGRYTLASVGARSLYVLVAPVFGVVYPQMASLHASGDTVGIAELYRSGTRLMMALVVPVAVYSAVFSREIFTLWTGDSRLAESLSPVFRLLVLGAALNGAMHFPYALQLAYGKSSLSLAVNGVLLAVYAPLTIVLCGRYGVVGAAAAWAILNGMYLVLGTWLTHREMLRDTGARWIVGDVGLPVLIGLVVMGAGMWAIQGLDLGVAARMAAGAVVAGAAFVAIFPLSPGLLAFARRLFAPGSSLLRAAALPRGEA